MTLKDVLNAVLGESGFLEKVAFASSSDVDDKQMVSIANRMAYQIMNFAPWSAMEKSHTITMTDDLTYPLPTDFQNIISDSVWEEDGSRRVELPTAKGRWYMYKYSAYSDGGTLRARLMGDTIELYDTQPGEKFSFAYLSNTPITDSGGVPKERFTQDDDEFILDSETLITGVQSKWAKAKMMPQADEWKGDFMLAMGAAFGRDSGGRTIGGISSEAGFISSRQPYYPLYRR